MPGFFVSLLRGRHFFLRPDPKWIIAPNPRGIAETMDLQHSLTYGLYGGGGSSEVQDIAMSLSAVIGISLSGMQAQQTRAAATANNVANAMTPAYDRLKTTFSSEETGGVRASVSPSGGDTS